MTLFFFCAGLVLLVVGAEALVRGASRLAGALGISPLIIGLTVVAFGTSAPELSISVQSAVSGQAGIAVGNVVGSNIFNVLFILGLSACITPLVVAQQLVRLDVPVMIAISALVFVLGADGVISRLEGGVLFLCLVGYTLFLIYLSRRENRDVQAEYEKEYGKSGQAASGRHILNAGLVLGGLGLLILGSTWLIDSAVILAQYLGLSELIVGLTIVAAGTSLPEVMTSVIASFRGERDIAVGNVVGSNLFNMMGVMGLSSMVAPAGLSVSSVALGFDLPVMVAVSVMCLPIFLTGNLISRWEGVLFLSYYVAYMVYLVLGATHHDALPAVGVVMLYAVVPLTALILLIGFVRAILFRRKRA